MRTDYHAQRVMLGIISTMDALVEIAIPCEAYHQVDVTFLLCESQHCDMGQWCFRLRNALSERLSRIG